MSAFGLHYSVVLIWWIRERVCVCVFAGICICRSVCAISVYKCLWPVCARTLVKCSELNWSVCIVYVDSATKLREQSVRCKNIPFQQEHANRGPCVIMHDWTWLSPTHTSLLTNPTHPFGSITCAGSAGQPHSLEKRHNTTHARPSRTPTFAWQPPPREQVRDNDITQTTRTCEATLIDHLKCGG